MILFTLAALAALGLGLRWPRLSVGVAWVPMTIATLTGACAFLLPLDGLARCQLASTIPALYIAASEWRLRGRAAKAAPFLLFVNGATLLPGRHPSELVWTALGGALCLTLIARKALQSADQRAALLTLTGGALWSVALGCVALATA